MSFDDDDDFDLFGPDWDDDDDFADSPDLDEERPTFWEIEEPAH